MTTESILYLFPDTNLFVQCRDLNELDWSEWDAFDEVHLLVSRPVQREIDNQKGRGNTRLSHRARSVYSTFRTIISSDVNFMIVRDTAPRVKLLLEGPSLPSEELRESLDYSKPDDEVIGCLYRFRKEHPDYDVRLLTHDGGPMMTAKSLGLPFVPIKDDWLLTPEHNENERTIARLNQELATLKRNEPSFQVKCVNQAGEEIDHVDVVYRLFEPLVEPEVEEFIAYLKREFPVITDFEPKSRDTRSTIANLGNILGARSPVSQEQIGNYTNREYPEWIKTCRSMLASIHEALEREAHRPLVHFTIENTGTRPGHDTLLEFFASGDFEFYPPEDDLPRWVKEEKDDSIHIPSPPKPPRGRSLHTMLGDFDKLLGAGRISPEVLRPLSPRQHDPNAWYYKPLPIEPTEVVRLSCDQWRHGLGEQDFPLEIRPTSSSSEINGMIECVIHAENLSTPARKKIAVKVAVLKENTREYASRQLP